MKCPVDNTELAMTDRQGIEIDYCPQCRGIWLDRGELDKIIERTGTVTPSRPQGSDSIDNYERSRREEDRDGRHYGGKKHKREGFLGDLFDF